MRRRPDPERGFALLLVVLALAVIAVAAMQVLSTGWADMQVIGRLRDAAAAAAAADGAVHEAAFGLVDRSAGRWAADGQRHDLAGGPATIAVWVTEPRGLVNPNTATPPLVAALVRAVGGDAATALRLAAAIFDWRTPGRLAYGGGDKTAVYPAHDVPTGRRFSDLEDLAGVPGMTAALLEALRPHLSLFNFGVIDPARADPLVVRALTEAGVGQPADDDVGQVVMVRADATLPGGTRFSRRAVLLLRPTDDGRPFRILAWESG